MHVYVAMWNFPGCMPESDPAVFTSRRQAEAYLRESRDAYRDGLNGEPDPYVYSVTREVVARPGDRSIEARYARYEARCAIENLNAHDKHMWRVHGCPSGPI